MVDPGFDIGGFGDARRAAVGAFFLERVIETGSLVVRRIGGDRAGEMAVHRFLSSAAVQVSEIVETVAARTASACRGRRVVAVQDTTEINFAGRELARRGLGPGGDGVSAGFFMHPVVAVDGESEALLGLVDAQIWTRDTRPRAPRRHRDFAAKESHRWLAGMAAAAERLAAAAEVVVVMDREGDIYAPFARRPPSIDLIVRAAQDRALAEGGKLFAAAAAWRELGRIEVSVASRGPGDPGRRASVALRADRVMIRRPKNGADPSDPPTLELTLVEAREVGKPARGEPLLWRLLTTLPVAGLADAAEVVRLYRLRWRIEQVFRSLKSDGLGLADVQMQEAERLFKLAAVGLVAATRTIQLVDARHGSTRPASDVIDEALLDAAEAIGRSKEGATQRQKNPHPPRSLAWLAWIIARLGGWNCYYKPPGPKTMRQGWNQFAAMAAGYILATHATVP
jgi:Transposase DDE domain